MRGACNVSGWSGGSIEGIYERFDMGVTVMGVDYGVVK